MKKQQAVHFTKVKVTDGFWRMRQDMNAETTIYAVQKRFDDTGRFDAYRGTWREGMPNKPYIWLTGDVEKWIESVAYLRRAGKCAELEELCDKTIDLIEANQLPDGYYNMWLLQAERMKRWTNRDWHELYAIGHLIEAGVAYYEATGKDKLLKIACRAADHVYTVFVEEKSAAFFTPGHEEIELALVRLYRCTGEKKYLELSKHFIDERGMHGEEKIPPTQGHYTSCNARYEQAHLPVREQTTAEGHAVRAVYLYSGMADIAYEYEDEELLAACRKIFDNMKNRRMYVTGGIGSTHRCEGFTIDFDLPNLTAYTESCAAIGLMMFARRMQMIDTDAKYADVIEQVMYNGFLSSTSLGGNAFFYENPLEIDPKLTNREAFALKSTRMPITQRVEVFTTSCCPPNITRTMASIGDYLYNYNEDTVFVQQYIDSDSEFDMNGKTVKITQKTKYPVEGSVRITVEGADKVALRIPAWCDKWSVKLNGKAIDVVPERGYAYIPAGEIELELDMTPYAVEASPFVADDAGRVAIMRGPVVYCLEAVDNGENLRDIHVDLESPIETLDCSFCGLPTLMGSGWRRDSAGFEDALYLRKKQSRVTQELKFIPYYSFANRGETEMIIWILS